MANVGDDGTDGGLFACAVDWSDSSTSVPSGRCRTMRPFSTVRSGKYSAASGSRSSARKYFTKSPFGTCAAYCMNENVNRARS